MKVLELFCGIGGCAAALEGRAAATVAAVDINRAALAVYRHNFAGPTCVRTIESLRHAALWQSDLWWLSPPCQPYTRRGKRRDIDDPRAAALLAVVDRIAEYRPRALALENVVGFAESLSRRRLIDGLTEIGYDLREIEICPTALGIPNRRPRYYLVAARDGLAPLAARPDARWRVADCLDDDDVTNDADARNRLRVDAQLLDTYRSALDVVDPSDPLAITQCFTAAYGRSLVRSGSYLRVPGGVRRFAPREILRLLGFPGGYRLPEGLTLESAWRLVGNSVSVPVVRWVLSMIRDD